MRTKKIQRSSLLVAIVVALAASAAQAQEPIPPSERLYQQGQKDAEPANNNDAVRRDSDVNRREASYHSKDSMSGKHTTASKLIGKEVTNDQNERLGKVQDLVMADDFKVKFAVLSVGGTLGAGASRIAIPISDLKCGGDSIRLSATKEELKNAAKNPTGEWTYISGEEWTRNVDGYYGHPMNTALRDNRESTRDYQTSNNNNNYNGNSATPWYERESLISADQVHENVRAIKGQGAQELINHDSNANLFDDTGIGADTTSENSTDRMLRQSVNNSIRQDYDANTAQAVSVTSANGEVTLRGTVASETEKQAIETRVKAVNGVTRVNNQLKVSR